MSPQAGSAGVRVVALLEAAKAAIVIVAGFGLLSAIHEGAAQVVEELARHMHLNPAKGYPQIFVALARETSNAQLQLLAAGAFAYAALRSVEAFGLWRQRRWAQWLSVASGVIYMPYELFEIAHGVTPLKIVTLLANAGIVAYMGYALRVSRRPPTH